jgi:hypothetical protein
MARCEEADAEENPVVFHEAILYAAAFLYEHREEADYSRPFEAAALAAVRGAAELFLKGGCP